MVRVSTAEVLAIILGACSTETARECPHKRAHPPHSRVPASDMWHKPASGFGPRSGRHGKQTAPQAPAL